MRMIFILMLAFSFNAYAEEKLTGECAVKASDFLRYLTTNTTTHYGAKKGEKNVEILTLKQTSSTFDENSGTTTHFFNVTFKAKSGQELNPEAGYQVIMGSDKDKAGNNIHCYLYGFSLIAG